MGVVVLQTVERLEAEADLVIKKQHPEQAMLALLRILDLLKDEFPKCVSVHFGRREYLAVKEKYLVWRQTCSRVPKGHTEKFDENAEVLFARLDRKLKVESMNSAPSDNDATEIG